MKRIKKSEILFIIEIFLLFLLCYVHSVSAGQNCDFYPINGTFQNFNPVRRFLSGQIPCKDFYDYLGLGHLFVGSFFTFIFGNNYHASLIAFSFLSFFSLSLISFFLGYIINRNKIISLSITNILLVILLLKPAIFTSSILTGDTFKSALERSLETGNSARFIRGMALPLYIGLFVLIQKIILEISHKKNISEKINTILYFLGCSLINSFSIFWSNDFGLSCFICGQIVFLWCVSVRFRNLKKILIYFSIEILCSVFFIFILGEIITLGHFFNWLDQTFGNGNYQRWYYGSGASHYIYEIDFSFITLLQFFVAIYYAIKIFTSSVSKNDIIRYALPGFANLTCFCVINEYKLLSGGSLTEVAYSVLFVTLLFEFLNVVKIKKNSGLSYISCLCTLCCILFIGHKAFFSNKQTDNYSKLLGGSCNLYNDITVANTFLGDKKIFSTYASAQEIIQNQFQPSGTDYIIHVLGDTQRAKYLESFRNGNFDYAVTQKESFTPWEYWIKRANWFFYRELYRNYIPVFENSYEKYWRKTSKALIKKDNIQLRTENINRNTKKIIINTDKEINGTADVYLDYKISKVKEAKRSKLCFNQNLIVTDSNIPSISGCTSNYNSLRAENSEFIPIEIKDGYGEITLTCCPVECTELIFNNTYCKEIFILPEIPLTLASLTDSNWTYGVLNGEHKTLLFSFNNKLLKKIKESKFINSNEKIYEIINVDYDSSWIRVSVDRDATGCAYPSEIIFSK